MISRVVALLALSLSVAGCDEVSFLDAGAGADAGESPTTDAGAACIAPGDYDETLTLDGVEHRYRLHVPAGREGLVPLVVQLHGGASTGAAMDRVTGLTALGDAEGFAVLTPEGWAVPTGPQVWNAGACCGPVDAAPDHVAAVDAMLDAVLARDGCLDARRVYATGHSNGGMMTYRLACELSERVAAVAVSAGTLADVDLGASPPTEAFVCAPSRPMPILHVHGLEDECVVYEGGTAPGTGNTLRAVEETVDLFRTLGACEGGTDVTEGEVRRRAWPCAEGATVELLTVASLGHPWAGSPLYGAAGRCGGTTTDAVSTTAEAWRFFQAHALPAASMP